jgi:hypothetical protein
LFAGALCVAGPAAAESFHITFVASAQSTSNPFSALVGERRERPAERQGAPVERYVLASDDRALLIQARTRTARVKFLCGPEDPRLDCTLDPEAPAAEIYLLTVTRGPRGDSIFKNADGEPLLRIASYGGATVFWPGEGQGNAASKSFGDDRGVELARTDLETAERRAKSATAVISALAGAPITFDIVSAPPGENADAAVLADAVVRAAIGIKKVADDPTGARALAERVKRVVFDVGSAPGVSFDGAALLVTYVPDQDIAGRPSSRVVERFLEESL